MIAFTSEPTEGDSSSQKSTTKTSNRLPKASTVRQHFERTYAPAFILSDNKMPKGIKVWNEKYVTELERRVDIAHNYQLEVERVLGKALTVDFDADGGKT